ncbi:FkbM family methyltransferase [bacterium]|nr:FkbM family methyltransferase [bacterium]
MAYDDIEYIYGEDQAKELFPYWPEKAEQFIVCGTADSNEAQTVKNKFPDIKCVGFEPNDMLREKQREKLHFPGKLRSEAIWSSDKELMLSSPTKNPRSSSVCRDLGPGELDKTTVQGRSLDSLSDEIGPFNNSVLWIDIEHAELEALKGATKLLSSGDILLINLEVMSVSMRADVTRFLLTYRYKLVHSWGVTIPNKSDLIFKYFGNK